MLPKVASQIFHHTSRAVSVIQSQTGTFRNVLQSGRTTGAGSSSGRAGSSEPGGPKSSTSSRFHPGFVGAARTLSHVDASGSQVDSVDLSDDTLEPLPSSTSPLGSRIRRKLRSSSLSQVISNVHDDKSLNVLRVVQQHVRNRHAFAAAAAASADASVEPALIAPKSLPTGTAATDNTDVLATISAARNSGKGSVLIDAFKRLRRSTSLTLHQYNAFLEALFAVREPGSHPTLLLHVYNDMLAESILPNFRTYTQMILALTDRDRETESTIQQLQDRMRVREKLGLADLPGQQLDADRIASLRSENNFGSALRLFQAATLLADNSQRDVVPHVYTSLLRCCAAHGNLEAALHVYDRMTKRNIPSSASSFAHLIEVHAKAKDLAGAEEVFDEFKRQYSKEVNWAEINNRPEQEAKGLEARMRVYNKMIEAYILCGQPASALSLLETMMDTHSGEEVPPTSIPPPSTATFTNIIKAFAKSGDVQSALAWFDRLAQQNIEASTATLVPTVSPTRPSLAAWSTLLTVLALEGRMEDFNRVFVYGSGRYPVTHFERVLAVEANLGYLANCLDLSPQQALAHFDFLFGKLGVNEVFHPRILSHFGGLDNLCNAIVTLYGRYASLDETLVFIDRLVRFIFDNVDEFKRPSAVRALLEPLLSMNRDSWTLAQRMHLARHQNLVGMPIDYPDLLNAYTAARGTDVVSMLSSADWCILLEGALSVEPGVVPLGLTDVLEDFAQRGLDPSHWPQHLLVSSAQSLVAQLGQEEATAFLNKLGPKFNALIAKYESGSASPTQSEAGSSLFETTASQTTAASSIRVDPSHSWYVDECTGKAAGTSAPEGYERFEKGARAGIYPNPQVLGRLINAMGRRGEVEKVHTLYNAAQNVLQAMDSDRQQQSVGWFQVEDQMIIALAHAGDVDAAHVHRARILAQGGTPSSDAYGALIQHVKDTTDDTANAMALFNEAIQRGVAPNIYLYNTIISKLAKARKADQALQLFNEMKARRILPSSVTYGTVIAACCRVGDAQSAENLFEEMAMQRSFKPRIPPYNTMMQLYTQTRPDRERALYYYDAMKQARIRPTAHTYKLLLDAYGTLEPLDFESMERTFRELIADRSVQIQGTHWAALINAYGCAGKDMDKALAIFDSIATHPTTTPTSGLPDAVCFEALLNVIVTLRRPDLIPSFLERLASHNIHMTAYIANLLIKGYAAAGDIDRARAVFESLVDPPQGIAAPLNHTEPAVAQTVPPDAPVFREPSTWEAMVRAELGHGNREQAMDLLRRLQTRAYPEAVVNRINAIMLDEPEPFVSTETLHSPVSPNPSS
ncbi:hypothetical protein K474DRAFT_1664256 [Panus rudis PR-1116 ss-1]|nr:hypothetical protein K474DRAFT_1664256 [Panus rudis PR-1116 ss-1]